ncbi:hypothetical protein SLOPH_758, partial [Spraguea lophii 42_110]
MHNLYKYYFKEIIIIINYLITDTNNINHYKIFIIHIKQTFYPMIFLNSIMSLSETSLPYILKLTIITLLEVLYQLFNKDKIIHNENENNFYKNILSDKNTSSNKTNPSNENNEKVILLTGGTSGIGEQILKYLINDNYKIIILGSNEERLNYIVKQFTYTNESGNVTYTSESSNECICKKCKREHKKKNINIQEGVNDRIIPMVVNLMDYNDIMKLRLTYKFDYVFLNAGVLNEDSVLVNYVGNYWLIKHLENNNNLGQHTKIIGTVSSVMLSVNNIMDLEKYLKEIDFDNENKFYRRRNNKNRENNVNKLDKLRNNKHRENNGNKLDKRRNNKHRENNENKLSKLRNNKNREDNILSSSKTNNEKENNYYNEKYFYRYSISKYALLLFLLYLKKKYKCIAIHPGTVNTNLFKSYNTEYQQKIEKSYNIKNYKNIFYYLLYLFIR